MTNDASRQYEASRYVGYSLIYAREIVRSLDAAEAAVNTADTALQIAKAKFDAAASSFAGLREQATDYMGQSPFLLIEDKELWGEPRPHRGLFRFLRMGLADAVLLALRETEKPMSPVEIGSYLITYGYEGPIDGRALNAAIQGLVKQTEARVAGSDGVIGNALYERTPADERGYK